MNLHFELEIISWLNLFSIRTCLAAYLELSRTRPCYFEIVLALFIHCFFEFKNLLNFDFGWSGSLWDESFKINLADHSFDLLFKYFDGLYFYKSGIFEFDFEKLFENYRLIKNLDLRILDLCFELFGSFGSAESNFTDYIKKCWADFILFDFHPAGKNLFSNFDFNRTLDFNHNCLCSYYFSKIGLRRCCLLNSDFEHSRFRSLTFNLSG